MRKPIIAVTPEKVVDDLPVFGKMTTVGSGFYGLNWLQRNGAIPVIPDFLSDADADEFIQTVDGLFMTGGADVTPALYGEEKLPCCGDTEPDRDASDLALMKAAIKHNKPIIMVCRSSQIGNVFFGGTLYQDIKTQYETDINHPYYALFRTEKNHEIDIVPDSPLAKIMDGELRIGVNSTHHQAVKDPGNGVIVQARATDGIVESWYVDNGVNYIRAYQWHPEIQIPNKHEQAIIDDFLKAVRERMK